MSIDLFWVSGLPPRYSSSTKPVYFPGHNKLGPVLESVRSELVKEDVLTHLLSDTTNGQDVIYIPQISSSVDDMVHPVPTAHSLPQFEILLEDSSELENRDNPTPLPQVPEESIAGSMMNDHIERKSPAKESTISERKKENITRSNPNQSKCKNAHRKPKPTYTKSTGESRIISSMLDAMKQKLTPDKEADTSQNNQKCKGMKTVPSHSRKCMLGLNLLLDI